MTAEVDLLIEDFFVTDKASRAMALLELARYEEGDYEFWCRSHGRAAADPASHRAYQVVAEFHAALEQRLGDTFNSTMDDTRRNLALQRQRGQERQDERNDPGRSQLRWWHVGLAILVVAGILQPAVFVGVGAVIAIVGLFGIGIAMFAWVIFGGGR